MTANSARLWEELKLARADADNMNPRGMPSLVLCPEVFFSNRSITIGTGGSGYAPSAEYAQIVERIAALEFQLFTVEPCV